jgi:hypothetical protein
MSEVKQPNWTEVKRRQAHDADSLAAVASGIGEYGVANACYKLAAILRQQATSISDAERGAYDMAPGC